ncbi:MAG: TolC family protein [Planctomycetes bacterium]|nr:TolC family protein [Planctomycetota bacterium]
MVRRLTLLAVLIAGGLHSDGNQVVAQQTTLEFLAVQNPNNLLQPEETVVAPQPLPADVSVESGTQLPGAPNDPQGTSLDELVLLAQTHNPALHEAAAKVRVAQGTAVQAGLPPNPTFFTSSPQWAGSVSQYNWVLGQDFITAGKLRLSQAAAFRAVEQSQLDFTRTRYEVLTSVRRQFYLTATAQRRSEVLQELSRIATSSRDVGQRLRDAGESNKADAMLLDIELDRAQLAHEASLATLAASRKQLAAIVGLPDIDIGPLRFDLSAETTRYDLEAVRQGVVDTNAVAAIAAVEIQKTHVQLRRAMAEPWPNFNVQAGYQYAVEGPRNDQGYGQFTMSLPLWNRNQGGIRAARADVARATAGLSRVENDLSQQTAEALGQYMAASERVAIYQSRILPKAREVFQLNNRLFEQGQTDFLRLLQAQRTLIEADLGYIDAQEIRWTSGATVAGLLQMEQFP